MYGDTSNLPEAKRKLDAISPSFCMAKWLHSTIHLMNGTTHSCHLPPIHKIPIEEIKANPAAIHNTSEKKQQRKLMLEGKRPEGCHICWDIEDLPSGNRISNRILHGTDNWITPHFDYVKNLNWDADVYPTYLELSFSSLCNFKCSYCSPHVSTSWHAEIKEHGPYQLSQHQHQNVEYFRKIGWMPIEDEDNNPYIDAFWKWWPEAYQKLNFLRITGGEPLLSKHTFRLLDWVNENPHSNLTLEVNSNLGFSEKVMEKFITKLKTITSAHKLRSFAIHTSLDNYGKRAEYIRHGLDFSLFQKNLVTYLEEIPYGGIAFMCTFNALSIEGFEEFLDFIIELRAKYQPRGRRINIDLPHLKGPEHLSVKILPDSYQQKMEYLIQKMEQNLSENRSLPTFRPMEIEKLRRIREWMQAPIDPQEKKRWQKDFSLFFKEHDRRRGTDFLSTFPHMSEFWNYCASL